MSSAQGPSSSSSGPNGTSKQGQPRTVTLAKGGHRWSFTCVEGEEPALLRSVTDLALRDDVPFDWFDAALVGHQIARRLRSGLNRVDKTADEV